MNGLINAGTVQGNLLVIRVTEMKEGKSVMSALVRLDGEFASGVGEGLHMLLGCFLVSLDAVVHLEWCCTVHDQRSRHTSIARANQKSASTLRSRRRHVPFVNLLPFDGRSG